MDGLPLIQAVPLNRHRPIGGGDEDLVDLIAILIEDRLFGVERLAVLVPLGESIRIELGPVLHDPLLGDSLAPLDELGQCREGGIQSILEAGVIKSSCFSLGELRVLTT